MRKAFRLTIGVLFLVVFYGSIFILLMDQEGQSQNADPLTAVYWVIVTITTLGYGDIVFHSTTGRLFSVVVSLTGVAILWALIMPLVITPRMESLLRAAPNSVPEDLTGHIIISGYNPIVETLAEKFRLLKMPYLIVERSEDVAKEIYRKYPVLNANPSEAEALREAKIEFARVFIANEKDELNAEVILTVRELSNIEVIALVDDLTRDRFLNYAGASRIISPKTLLGTFLAQITSPPKHNVFPGAIQLFGDLKIVELPVYPGAELIGKSLAEQRILDTGAKVAGIWQRGVFVPKPGADEVMRSNSVLMAVGNVEQLTRIREFTLGTRKKGRLIILGYGDVGRRVASVLKDHGISPFIVDKSDLEAIPFEQITGDATMEINLLNAGIKEAVGVFILLNDDSDAVYATLLAKNLNPNAFVVVRANHFKSAEKIYRAGADYVASVPIVASHMLAKIIQDKAEELDLLYEDLELNIFHCDRRSKLAGTNLEDLKLAELFGCGVVALERKGQVIPVPEQETVVKEGDILALIGSPKGIEACRTSLERRSFLGKLMKRWTR